MCELHMHIIGKDTQPKRSFKVINSRWWSSSMALEIHSWPIFLFHRFLPRPFSFDFFFDARRRSKTTFLSFKNYTSEKKCAFIFLGRARRKRKLQSVGRIFHWKMPNVVMVMSRMQVDNKQNLKPAATTLATLRLCWLYPNFCAFNRQGV